MKIVIRGGEIIDPANRRQGEVLDLLLLDGKIISIGRGISAADAKIIDASGLVVTPGLIDMHTHFREPGQEHKETIYSGTRAAAKGGFTSAATMANTQPVADSPKILRDMAAIAKRDGMVNVFPIGSVTLGLRGEELVDVDELVKAGAVALSDDGMSVKNPEIMKRAMMLCKEHGITVIAHCEKTMESHAGWVMNQGAAAARL